MKFAAIDIGSNAIRLLVMNVFQQSGGEPMFKKESLIRIPLRLGEEAFVDGFISDRKADKLSKTMGSFKSLMEVSDITKYKAAATAALREASNGEAVIKKVFEETGVQIDIVDGSKEAEIIYGNHIAETLTSDKAYLYIDVGGGSAELSLMADGAIKFSKSFPIGTLKILNNQVEDSTWDALSEYVKQFDAQGKKIEAIGTGGNINKLYKLYGNTSKGCIYFHQLQEAYDHLTNYTYAERVTVLGLKPDRADVIIPACEIFTFIMEHAGITKVLVPKIGLSDGLVHQLYEKHVASLANS